MDSKQEYRRSMPKLIILSTHSGGESLNRLHITCPYCGADAILRRASWVHGNSDQSKGKYLYVCRNWPQCDSYVAAHAADLTPMGTLANKALRHKRIQAHRALEQYQKTTRMDRWATYLWLEGKLGLNKQTTHIGMFSEETCDAVISICQKASRTYKTARPLG